MTISVLQEKAANFSATPATSISVTLDSPVTAGSVLHVFASHDLGSPTTMSVDDDRGNSYTAAGDLFTDGTSGGIFEQYEAHGVAAGSTTVTLHFAPASTYGAIWVREIGGAANAGFDGHAGSARPSATAPTLSATAANQPGLTSSLGAGDGQLPSAGGGFTAGGTGWNFGGGNQARTQSKRFTATGAQASTFAMSPSGPCDILTANFPEAPSGAVLGATPAAAATLTGTLTTAIQAAAAAAVVATLAAGLATSIRAAATLSAQSTLTGSLTTSIRLASGPAAQATGTGALSTAIRVAAALADVSTLTGALSTSIRLAAAPASVVTLQGTLDTGAAALAATPAAVATLTGALSTSIRAAAALAAQASITAALSTGIRLAAAPAGQVTLSAGLTTSIRPAASLTSIATLAGSLTIPKPLDAQLVAAASLAGSLTTQIRFAASLTAQCVLTATLSSTSLTGSPGYVIARARPRNFTVARSTVRTFTVSRMSKLRFESKDPSEKVKLVFDFTQDLPAGVSLSGTPTIAVTKAFGTATDEDEIANGAAGFDVTTRKVVVPVQAGTDKNDYRVSVRTNTTDAQLVLELDGTLPSERKEISRMRVFMPITKIDEQADGTLIVHGIASTEAKDAAGEVVRADAMKAALPDFFKYGSGNLREMHQLLAAGTVDKADIGDDGQTYIETTVVDPVAIAKVKAGVYKGFSIGGNVTARDKADKKLITGIRLSEISLVDRPANPGSVITLFKAEESPMTTAAQLSDKDAIDRLAKMLDEKNLSPQAMVEVLEEAIAKAAAAPVEAAAAVVETSALPDPAVVDPVQKAADDAAAQAAATAAASAAQTIVALTGDPLKKGMSDLRTFADLLQSAAWLAMGSAGEAEWERDASPVPAALRAWITAGCKIFADMTAEETAELVASLKPTKKADEATDLQKAAIAAQTSQVEDLVKAALAEPLTKIAALTDQLAKADDRIKQLESQPLPGKALLKAIGKGDDVGTERTEQQVDPIMKADGSVDEVATELKKIHQAGGRIVGFR